MGCLAMMSANALNCASPKHASRAPAFSGGRESNSRRWAHEMRMPQGTSELALFIEGSASSESGWPLLPSLSISPLLVVTV